MMHISQKLKNNTLQCWMFFQSLLVNLGQFFDENSKQILTIFILLLLAGQAVAGLNPVARRQDFSRNNDSNQDADVCVDGECTSDAVAFADFTPPNNHAVAIPDFTHSNNNEVCILDEMPTVPQLTCLAKPKATPPAAPTCPKDSYLKENAEHKLMGWGKVEQHFSKNFIVTPGAREYYAKNKGTFEADRQTLFAMVKEVYFSAASLRCTIETVLFASKRSTENVFRFCMVTPQEEPGFNPATGGDGAAAYHHTMNSIGFCVGILQNDYNRITIIHEFRHALVASENYVFKRHLDRSKLFSECIPYGQQRSDVKEQHAYLTLINEVKDNINYYLDLLNKEHQINDEIKSHSLSAQSFTTQELKALEEYKQAIKNYVAVIRQIPVGQLPLSEWQLEKLIDDNLTIAAPGFIRYEKSGQIPLYFTKVEFKNGGYLGTCVLSEPGDLRAPLFDALPIISQYEKRYTDPVTFALETDAVLHQLYQLYPKLFNLLAEKLLAHTTARAIPEHNNCIISETRRLDA